MTWILAYDWSGHEDTPRCEDAKVALCWGCVWCSVFWALRVMDNEDYYLIIILIVPAGLLTTLRLTFQDDAELGLVSDEIPCQGNLGEKCS